MTGTQLDLDELDRDPAPTYARLRAKDEWAWSEQLGMWLVSRYDDAVYVDNRQDVFSSEVEGAMTTRAMGLSMLRTEGPAHRRLRSAANPPLKRRAVARTWTTTLEQLADQYLEPLRSRRSFDLVEDFASPFTGACLARLLGLDGASPETIRDWSDTFIAGASNSRNDPDVWRAADHAKQQVQAHVDAAVDQLAKDPAGTVIGAMVTAAVEPPLSLEEIGSNVRLVITGGFNDARDLVATLAWLLINRHEVRTRVLSDPSALDRSIEECTRWLSPVGTYPRQVVTEMTAGGANLRPGDRVLVLAASANWDESHFPFPEVFDIDRPNLHEHLGFSVGVHFCLGAHLVRAMARVAVPRIHSLSGLTLVEEPELAGWMFRGPSAVLVEKPAASDVTPTHVGSD